MRMLDLLHPAPPQSEIHDATVVAVRTRKGHTDPQLPQFFSNGALAIPGREPELLGTEYQIRLQPPRGRAHWLTVNHEAYLRAQQMIGKR